MQLLIHIDRAVKFQIIYRVLSFHFSVLASHGRVVLLTSSTLKDFLLKQVELMNATVAPPSSPLGDPCLNVDDIGEIIPCVSQETKATDDLTECSSISCDSYQGKSTATPVHNSVKPSVPQQIKSAVVSTDCSLASSTNGETKTCTAPVSHLLGSTGVCNGDQLQCASETPCTDSCNEGNLVHGGQAIYDDTSASERSSVNSTIACDMDAVLNTDQPQDALQKLCSHWTLESTHYFKLGETHSHACVFQKSII